jgi:hypothetical protein
MHISALDLQEAGSIGPRLHLAHPMASVEVLLPSVAQWTGIRSGMVGGRSELGRAPVFLQAAVRFVRQGALDHPGIQRGLEVVLAKGGPVGEA